MSPVPYRVAYSGRVREELLNLVVRAKARGLGRQVLDALKELDRRLHIYPQFGEPLRLHGLTSRLIWRFFRYR